MRVLKVGGFVRDTLLGLEPKDIDYLVVGADSKDIESMLEEGYTQVGKDFPVFLHPVSKDEYALARTERSTGVGHHDFEMSFSPDVTIEEDLIRRDLTINAMAFDEEGDVIDPFGGQEDLDDGLLRHTSEAFKEDPLRVFRVARFSARYAHLGFKVADETIELMSEMASDGMLKDLSAERVWKELSRALMEPTPGQFFETLRDANALDDWFAPVKALIDVEQPPAHHPEGDVFIHTMMVLQQCARFNAPLEVRFACLAHDFGKALTPKIEWPKHLGHEKAGVATVEAFCKAMKVPSDCFKMASALTEFHTNVHVVLGRDKSVMSGKGLERLFNRLDLYRRPEILEGFLQGAEMDARGRTGYEDREYPNADIVRQVFKAANSVKAKEFTDQGIKGKDIGEHIYRKRLVVIAYTLRKMKGDPEFDYLKQINDVCKETGTEMSAKGFDLLFKRVGLYRYPDILDSFLESAEMAELSSEKHVGRNYPSPDTIRQVFEASRGVTGDQFVAQGFKGVEVGEQIHRKRYTLISEALNEIRGDKEFNNEQEATKPSL